MKRKKPKNKPRLVTIWAEPDGTVKLPEGLTLDDVIYVAAPRDGQMFRVQYIDRPSSKP